MREYFGLCKVLEIRGCSGRQKGTELDEAYSTTDPENDRPRE